MKYTILSSLLVITSFTYSQNVTPSIINSGSYTGKVDNIQFDFCLGELATTTIVNRDTITQGFLQPYYLLSGALPVTGWQFTAKRTSPGQVLLNWKTLQEINNKGFYIERKKETAGSFVTVGFIPSQVASGNSSTPLAYQFIDNNNSTGKTIYRLKQEDLNSNQAYSPLQIVPCADVSKLMCHVWPVPSFGPVYVIATGLGENARLLVYDMNGKKVRDLGIQNNTQVRIDGLVKGMYVLSVAGRAEWVYKIIVQ